MSEGEDFLVKRWGSEGGGQQSEWGGRQRAEKLGGMRGGRGVRGQGGEGQGKGLSGEGRRVIEDKRVRGRAGGEERAGE